MPDFSTLAVFTVASLALLIVPGPAVLYIVTRSIDQGRTAGVVSVLGIGVGSLVHVAAATLGVSALLLSSATAFNAVKYVGAAYLIFLGIRKLLSRDAPDASAEPRKERLSIIFRQGVIVNVLNPKTALFFFAFLPQFVDVSKGAVAFHIAVLGILFVTLGIISDGMYALLAAGAASRLKGNLHYARTQRLLTSSVYVALGILAALSGSKPTTT